MYLGTQQEYPRPLYHVGGSISWYYPYQRRMKQPIKLRADLLIALLFAMALHLAILSIDQVADVWPVVRYRTPVFVDYGSSVYEEDLPF